MEAIASETPVQITLKIYSTPIWNVHGTYNVLRKSPDALSWDPPVGTVTVGAAIATWVDTNVTVGTLYEYGLVPTGSVDKCHGNVLAGIKADRTLAKGRIAVVVTEDIIARLPDEYAQYKEDLVLDGWTVNEIVVASAPDYLSNGTGPVDARGLPTAPFPTNHMDIRNQLKALYRTYPNELKNVALIGKVPVAHSGGADYSINPDGHGPRDATGADAYYADMDGVWPDNAGNIYEFTALSVIAEKVKMGWNNVAGDNKFDWSEMSSITGPNQRLELGFGRIDFSNLVAAEYESTRNYFNKLHRYKTASPDFLPGRRSILRSSFGVLTHAYLAAMPSVVGMTNMDYIVAADRPAGPSSEDSDSAYTRDNSPYLFYFKGSESPGYSDGGRAVFWTGMQSHWGYWSEPGQNTMVRRLAEDNFALSFTWYISMSGTMPVNYLYHRLGMGGNAGDMMRVSMSDRELNNTVDGVYVRSAAGMFMNNMGDPAVRIFMFASPTGLQVIPSGGNPALSWIASATPPNEPPVIGYHVYRSADSAGPFTRLTSSYLTGTSYTDTTASSGKWYYQVKAVRLETTGGGTFYNTSLAAQQSIDLTGGPDPVSIDTNSVLPVANWNTGYKVKLAAIGGTPRYTWSTNTNNLPPGLTLSADGIISGTPATNGIFSFTAQVTDAPGQVRQAQMTITVDALDLQKVFPEAGGYVQKADPTRVSGVSESTMQISGGPTFTYDSYLRFDLSSIRTNKFFVRAKLVLFVDGVTPMNGNFIIKAALSADSADGWNENTLCYNNRLADSYLPTVTATNPTVPNEPVVVDVTDLVHATLLTDPNQKLTVRLFSDKPANFGQSARICNRRSCELARPALLVQTVGDSSAGYEPLPPFAGFTAAPTNGTVPLTVSFTDTSAGMITNRFWDFGDGDTTNTTATTLSHTYTASRTSTVQLVVSGPGGAATNRQVNCITATLFVIPSASFTATPTNGLTPLTVYFTDTSTGTITNRFWDFGDGVTTNTIATAVSHTYTAAGTNTVELIASGPVGASTHTKVNCIQVTAGAIISAHASDQQWNSAGASQHVGQTTCYIGSSPLPSTNAVIITVTNFDFNVAGTDAAARMNWSPGTTINSTDGTEIKGLKAATAVGDAGTTVLTMSYAIQADIKLYYRGANITLPTNATGWNKYIIRMRQIGTDMVTPVAFNGTGTIMNVTATGSVLPTIGTLPVTNGIIAGVPFTVVKEAGEWMTYSFDLTGRTGSFLTNWRIDPLQIYPPAVVNTTNSGNFEVDYIKITASGAPAATNRPTGATNLISGLVIPFLIPDIAGMEIVGAELRTTLNAPIGASVTNAGNVDVYGVRSHTNATTVASDYMTGTLLVDDWFKLEGGLAGTLSTGNSAALVSWLAGQAGTHGQKYVFLTLRPDMTELPVDSYATLNTGDAATNRPVLILTFHTSGGGTSLDDWRMKHFGTTSNAGDAADGANPAGDGIPNLIKYALGMSPTNSCAGSPSAPYGQWQAPHGFTYTFTYDPASGDVTLIVEATDNLLSGIWTDIDPLNTNNQVSVQNDTPKAGIQTITVKDSQTNALHRFLRLKAATP
jgi:PKD repeat protein